MAAGAAVRGLQDTVLHGVFVDDGLKRLFGRGEGAGIGAAENGLAVHGGNHAQLAVFLLHLEMPAERGVGHVGGKHGLVLQERAGIEDALDQQRADGGFLGGQPVGGIFLGVGEGLFEIGNLSVIGLLDFHLEVVDFSRVDELPGVKVGNGFQGGLGLFRVNAVKRFELAGQGVDVLAPSG